MCYLSLQGLKHTLCNVTHIGIFTTNGLYKKHNHVAIIDEDTFWLVYDKLKDERPEGVTANILWEPEDDERLKRILGTPEGTIEKLTEMFPRRSLEGIRQRAKFLTGSASIPGPNVNRRVAAFSLCDLDFIRDEDLCLDKLIDCGVFWKGDQHNGCTSKNR